MHHYNQKENDIRLVSSCYLDSRFPAKREERYTPFDVVCKEFKMDPGVVTFLLKQFDILSESSRHFKEFFQFGIFLKASYSDVEPYNGYGRTIQVTLISDSGKEYLKEVLAIINEK